MKTKPKQVTVNAITPNATDRAVFIGQTGSGKSTLARRLLRTRYNVWVLDVNSLLDWHLPDKDYPEGEYLRVSTIKQLLQYQEYPKLILQPSVEDSEDFELFDKFFKTVYLLGDMTVYVDEAYAVTKRQVIPTYYRACLTRGRTLNIETWTSTQRPAEIPSFILSESENTYCFKLKYPADLERMEKMTGFDRDYLQRLPKRQFCYTDGDRRYYKLQLNL